MANREQRREMARRQKQEEKQRKYTPQDLYEAKEKSSGQAIKFTVEKVCSCFALALRDVCGFGQKRICRVLECVNDYMSKVDSGEMRIDEIVQMLEEETGLSIKMED